MNLDCCHFGLQVASLDQARHFYVDALALTVLQDMPAMGLLAVRAGGVRLSIFEVPAPTLIPEGSIILRTDNLDQFVAVLADAGIAPEGHVHEAPGFMRYIILRDPSGNPIGIAEYQRDPLAAV